MVVAGLAGYGRRQRGSRGHGGREFVCCVTIHVLKSRLPLQLPPRE